MVQQTETAQSPHPDDIAVDMFAAIMKLKLAKSRTKGRGGWDDPAVCSVEQLAQMLVEHVVKGDPVDVANLAMMVFMRSTANPQYYNPAVLRNAMAGYVQGASASTPLPYR